VWARPGRPSSLQHATARVVEADGRPPTRRAGGRVLTAGPCGPRRAGCPEVAPTAGPWPLQGCAGRHRAETGGRCPVHPRAGHRAGEKRRFSPVCGGEAQGLLPHPPACRSRMPARGESARARGRSSARCRRPGATGPSRRHRAGLRLRRPRRHAGRPRVGVARLRAGPSCGAGAEGGRRIHSLSCRGRIGSRPGTARAPGKTPTAGAALGAAGCRDAPTSCGPRYPSAAPRWWSRSAPAASPVVRILFYNS
jgi:hypothetical protein